MDTDASVLGAVNVLLDLVKASGATMDDRRRRALYAIADYWTTNKDLTKYLEEEGDYSSDGEFFVDSSCIDCDLCRQTAPEVFAREDRAGQSFVAAQPAPAGAHRALMALVTCPTSSIGTRTKQDVRAAARAFPEPLFGDVAFCGYASEASYGAASYLIRRPDGNVLVDSPRFAEILVERIAALGGVRTMVLTHQDDVADHAKFHARFGCERVIHRADVRGDTRACERIIDGDTELAPDLRLLHVPGHTRGSIALLHGDVLFTGDHRAAPGAVAHARVAGGSRRARRLAGAGGLEPRPHDRGRGRGGGVRRSTRSGCTS